MIEFIKDGAVIGLVSNFNFVPRVGDNITLDSNVYIVELINLCYTDTTTTHTCKLYNVEILLK